MPPPPGKADAVVSFTAHNVVAAGLRSNDIHLRLARDDLGAVMEPAFLAWLGDRLRTKAGLVDVVLATGASRRVPALNLRPTTTAMSHPRVRRATRYRSAVSVYSDREDRGLIILGRGLAGRLEVSIEVFPPHRELGLGRAFALSAASLIAPHEVLFAQVAPGNAASLRAFLAAGYRPLCAEVLFLRNRSQAR